MHRWIRALAALAATGFLAACGGGGETVSAQRSVGQNLQSDGSATLMAQAVQASGLAPLLEGNSKYTLLLPDDQALAGSAAELRELIASDNKAALQDFVKAHLIEGEVGSKTLAAAADEAQRKQAQAAGQSLPPGTGLSNLLGALLGVTIDGGVVKVNGVPLVGADLLSRNGVLLFIASPLVQPSVFGIVQALPQTSTLEAAIRAAGLVNTLRGAGSYTLFAPTNDAFNRLLSELGLTSAQLLANKPLLTQVLTYHVLASRVLAANIVDGATPVTVQGQAIEFDLVRDARNQLGVKVKDARGRVATVTTTDLRASNGVVHLVDRVFLPSDKTIVGIASGDPQFSILVEAVVAAGLANTLSGPGPFTVFAPTNAAFAALLGELQITKEALLANKPLLTRVLTYHVLPSRSLAASFTNGQVLSPLQGQPLRAAVGSQGLSLTDARGRTARVIAANVQATNGVIHAIDRVVLPTDQTLVQVAQSLPQFSILVEAVVAAGLVDVLSGAGPFTVFAPTNDAFVALLGELGLTKAQLLADKALLVKVLTYHVLPAQVLSTQIPFDKPVTTVQGQTLTIGRDLKITDQRTRRAGIVATDVAATNGVIHVLDRVILPL
jgi:transforming growth factor-beta-induced protein